MITVAIALAALGSLGEVDPIADAVHELVVAALVGGLAGFGGRWLVSLADLGQTATSSSRQIAVLALALATYFAAAELGASGFIAAFVAGLVIADSPMASEARRRLLPFRDVFAVLFFVSVGSLLQPEARDALIGIEFNAFVPTDVQGPWWTALDAIAEGQETVLFAASMQDREGQCLRLAASATRYLRSNKILALVLARPDNKVESLVDAHPTAPTDTTDATAARA